MKMAIALTYKELRKCWIKGLRNGNVRKLSRLQRALYRACLMYARRVGRIVNEFLVGQLRPIVNILKVTFKVQALKAGLKRLQAMLSGSVSEWAPQIKVWSRDETYIFWIGLFELNFFNNYEY